MKKSSVIFYSIAVLLSILLILLLGWLWVILSSRPLDSTPARWLPWPVVCTTRGCITTSQWHNQKKIVEEFSGIAQTPMPADQDILTTLARQHLSEYSQVRHPVTMADARRYRVEVLNFNDETMMQEQTGLTFDDYDKMVVLPYLIQESIRQQWEIEDLDELYARLSQQRPVVVLISGWQWNKDRGAIENR